MAKPEEVIYINIYLIIQVLISTDENGNAVRVIVENTENNSLFESMKELMIILSKNNWENTKYVFDERFERIVNL